MDFFKSVFSDPSPPTSPDPSPRSTPADAPNPEPAPPPPPQPSSSWAFGSTLIRTLASKSETLIDNYYKDLQELGSGLKKETSVIRQAASRAVQDLPARLESGAAIAQESLEAVGQAIDNVGSTVSEMIGKDLSFASDDGVSDARSGESDDNAENSGNRDGDLNPIGNPKPYSRLEATIRALQCDVRTYCDEVEESGYDEWMKGFRVDEKREEIERLFNENGAIKEIYDVVVPVRFYEETFWCRYFYRVDKVVKAEEARVRIVKRAFLGEEEEELGWDFDDDADNDGDDNKNGEYKSKGKGVEHSRVENRENEEEIGYDNEDVGVSGMKSGDVVVDEEKMYNEKEGSDGKIGSDISIISSQRSSHAEDDLGWDEIEDIGSGNESKISSCHGSSTDGNATDLQKRLGSREEEELTWDIEDDEEHVKL